MSLFTIIAAFLGGALVAAVVLCWLLHCSHKAFTEAVTKSPKGK